MATAKSDELRALAQRVTDALPPEVVEVVLTGSVSRGVADDVSDIEMLVVTEEQLSLEEAFELARGALLAFTDPDCVPARDWLERLVAASDSGHGLVVGAMALRGGSAYERAVHLCKYAHWLPGGPEGPRTIAPTANALYTREAWKATGTFRGDSFSSDTLHSWQAAARVVELDRDRSHVEQVAGLPRPREVRERIAPEPAGVDRLERRLLLLPRPLVQVEDPHPGRARLVVVVADRQRDCQTGQVGSGGVPFLDQP